ncbi:MULTISPECIES: MlaD family protein [unclassified Gordonia (in: high G+C Gram-positive bacteria)]|uniref:MlaD family protein n=1 Tax=unclassified Gordonia (in: high G+C Gram-positive bacteria) TaxID=2657482 RepID=UPI001F11201F|nr:MlaD family protein [Gordonia sp. ABSL49_1]MCH5641533.1 MlaD family protein [Gordonia sp. ABSL49_1]
MTAMLAFLKKHSVILGNLALVMVMVVGLAYLAFGILRWEPLTGKYHLTINFPISGGLQDTSRVTLRGSQIGDVDSIQVQPNSVEVKVSIDEDVKINRNAMVAALGLSAAGEQYVDFQPPTADGPYFEDGDTINANQTHVTAPFPDLLESSLGVIEQIDPVKLRSVIENLDVALGSDDGNNQLDALFASGGTIFASLYRVLPQTTKLIQDSGTILKTTAGIQPDFGTTVASISAVINATVASDKEIRTLLNRGPTQLTSLTGSLNQLNDPLADVLKQVLDIARQGALRAPAIANLLPSIRDASVKSLAMFHGGAWWAFGSVFPRPACNYPVTPRRPTQVLELAVPVNLYCVTEDPNQQIRGSANAPRPPGDDTAGPPPGYDPNARTVPMDK